MSHTGPEIPLYNSLSKMFFLSLSVSVPVSAAPVTVPSVCLSVVFFSVNFGLFHKFLLLKNCYSIKYVLLAFCIVSCKSIWLLLSSLSTTPKYLKFSTLSNVLFYFSLNCFSFPLSYILSSLSLSVVRTFWQCFPFLQKVSLFLFHSN